MNIIDYFANRQGTALVRRRLLMIVAIVKNYGGTDEYRKFLGASSSIGIHFFVPVKGTEIPEEELWKIFRWVYEHGNHEDQLVLDLRASFDDYERTPIYGFEEGFDLKRILDSLQACRARIHVVFS